MQFVEVSITNDKYAIVGIWIGQFDSNNNIVWLNANYIQGVTTTVSWSVNRNEVSITVQGRLTNATGSVLVQYLVFI